MGPIRASLNERHPLTLEIGEAVFDFGQLTLYGLDANIAASHEHAEEQKTYVGNNFVRYHEDSLEFRSLIDKVNLNSNLPFDKCNFNQNCESGCGQQRVYPVCNPLPYTPLAFLGKQTRFGQCASANATA